VCIIALLCITDNTYTFADDYIETSDQNPVNFDTIYYITYILDGGTNSASNPSSFSSSDSAIKLADAYKIGYKFLGWFKDADFTKYISKITPSSQTSDLTLYAKFSQYIYLPVKYDHTDFYVAINETVGYINCFYDTETYFYENLTSVASMVSGHSTYNVMTSSGAIINTSFYTEEAYISVASRGIPSYIEIEADKYYSVSYELNGGYFTASQNPRNYYYVRADIQANSLLPQKDNANFVAWYSNEELTESIYTSSFTPHNLTLYARWSQIGAIEASITLTDFYEITTTHVDTITYYENDYDYVYSDNINELAQKYPDYDVKVYTSTGDEIPLYLNGALTSSAKTHGIPSYIEYDTPKIYSISYIYPEGTSIKGTPLFNYYTVRSDLKNNTGEPTLENNLFIGWFLNEDCTETVYTSSFTPHDITLYSKWTTYMFAPVYYYDASEDVLNYIEIGETYYYINELNEYVLGYLPDKSKQLPYYFNAYGATSFKAVGTNDLVLDSYTNEGYLYTKATQEIKFIYIYAHYTINFYVNGRYVFQSSGEKGEQITFPNFINGFIGKNYDAGHIGNYTIGKRYAIYIMKGWSETDTSDLTWFNKTAVTLVDESNQYGTLHNGEYVVDLYGYMTFYGKTNPINSSINYETLMYASHGLITDALSVSLDDLVKEHVTEISSDQQKNNVEKLLKYLKLDTLGQTSLGLIKKLFNGESVSINEIASSPFGKILLIAGTIVALCLIAINLYNFARALSKIHTNS